MREAEEYLNKHTLKDFDNAEGWNFKYIHIDIALKALELARKEVVMNPDKFIKDFQASKEYQKIADEVLEEQLTKKIKKELEIFNTRVRLETAKEIFNQLQQSGTHYNAEDVLIVPGSKFNKIKKRFLEAKK